MCRTSITYNIHKYVHSHRKQTFGAQHGAHKTNNVSDGIKKNSLACKYCDKYELNTAEETNYHASIIETKKFLTPIWLIYYSVENFFVDNSYNIHRNY